MAGSDSKAEGTESSQALGLTYCFQGSMKVHRGTGVSVAVAMHSLCVFVLVVYIRWISKYSIHCITNFIWG